jgi:hypothetical protein
VDRQFDLIYSALVLQHQPSSQLVEEYIAAFVRALRPKGLLVFQIPEPLSIRRRLQLRPRVYHLMRRGGVSARRLQQQGLHPITMRGLARHRVEAIVHREGGDIVRVTVSAAPEGGVDVVYYVSKEPKE